VAGSVVHVLSLSEVSVVGGGVLGHVPTPTGSVG
jgi:hypothetical protein